MARSSTLRCAAGVLLAASLLLPPLASAGEVPQGHVPAKPASLLAGLWSSLLQLLPVERRATATFDLSGQEWPLDPEGDDASAEPGADTGWLIDPDG
jgi:hypothetical protein